MEAMKETEPRSLPKETVGIWRLFAFFIPLGLSQSLVTISHVIINSTLARSPNPEIVITSYALALSLVGITERPGVLLRQTCSALVRDRVSFRAMSKVAVFVFLYMLLFGLLIAYTPLGELVFQYVFGVGNDKLKATLDVYRILMFISVFSGIRCLYHGIIISNKRTTAMTLGMVIRLIVMYGLSQYYLQTGQVTSGMVGAIIFMAGMVVECVFSFREGRLILKKKLPEKLEQHPVENSRHIFGFYRPLLYSSLLAMIIGPAINALLGKTVNMEVAIASFAIAASVAQLVQSFFAYLHQVVLNFYNLNRLLVIRFQVLVAFIPAILIGLLGYTPLGPWFMHEQMGVREELMHASLQTLRVFMIMSLLFPWLDYLNGIVMLKGQTKIMAWSQATNVIVTLTVLTICIITRPGWNGMIGALGQSLGIAGELLVVMYVLRGAKRNSGRIPGEL